MKKQTIQLMMASLLALCPIGGTAQSSTQNYILNRTFTSADGSASQRQVTYYDGLGRPVQTTDIGITPAKKDLVSLQEYDNQGRKFRAWLPVQNAGNGAYLNVSTLKSNAVSQYGGDSRPYTQTLYETSPLERPVTLYGTGTAWASKPTSYKYGIVTPRSFASEIAHLPMGSYLSIRTTDEDGRISYTFTDELGREFLTGRMNGNEMHFTYLEYDANDDLTAVHSPMSSTPPLGTSSTDLEGEYSYSYRYNPFHRRIMEKRPGCDAVYYIYDKGERLVFSQEGEQRGRGEWTFTIPDVFGRTLLKGVCKNMFYYDDYPFINIVTEAKRTNASNSLYGHTVSGVTLNNATLHGVNFYDDYAFIGKNGVPTSLNYATPPSGYGTRYTGGYKGLLTGTVTARLDASGVAGYGYTAYYYDDRGRVIQTRSTNHLGGTDVEYVAYNFVGDPVKRQHVHTASGKATQTETYTYTYDHAGRLTVTKYRLNSNAEITLSSNTYDELGRLQTKSLHGSATNKQTYNYNIRDWLTGISGSKFTQNLYYNTGSGTPQYGGNISSLTWKAGNESTVRGYKFAYDGLSRLTSATYGEGTSISSNANRFTEKVTGYDLNGNIKGLQRYGQTSSSAYGLIDDLTYTLSGNKLTRVDDAVNTSAYNNGFEFKDAVQQADEYAYDKNGNLTKDLNKNITSIQYNCLNLPSKVTFGNGNTITYLYAADGTKLRTVHKAGSTTTTTDYCGNVVYENGSQKYLLTEEGYVTLADTKYHYYGIVKETNHYYPFGGVFAATNNVQPYKYNGKEFDSRNGLNWYDYGARHYDATFGRFVSVDPLAKQDYAVSPYTYCGNNPIMYIDPDGRFANPIYDQEGNFLGTDNRGLQGDAIIMDSKFFQQGMEHELAEGLDLGLSSLDEGTRGIVEASVRSLADRPDYDGFVTVSEGIRWAKDHPNALNYPTPNNALYINAALLDFGELSVDKIGIPNIGKPVRTQLFTVPNTLESIYNERLRATVYALGRVNVTLQNPVLRTISVVNDEATYYDWNQGDSYVRRSAIFLERMRTGLNDTHGFRAYYYGYGVLRK